jgi:hypothetical protein
MSLGKSQRDLGENYREEERAAKLLPKNVN